MALHCRVIRWPFSLYGELRCRSTHFGRLVPLSVVFVQLVNASLVVVLTWEGDGRRKDGTAVVEDVGF